VADTAAADIAKAKTARQHFEERLRDLDEARTPRVATWEAIARHIVPELNRYIKSDERSKEADFSTILDGSGTQAAEVFAEGMSAGLTNQARDWFEMGIEDFQQAEREDVKAWFHVGNRAVLNGMSIDNFYEFMLRLYLEYGIFGTAAGLLDEQREGRLTGINFVPGEYYIATSAAGEVNTCYREFQMTAPQLVEQFGYTKCSESVCNAYKANNRTQKWWVVHAIEPVGVGGDEMQEIDHQLGEGMQYRSVYFERGSGNQQKREVDLEFLEVSGYFEFPVVCARLGVVGTDPYGFGRGHKALGDIKQTMYWTGLIDRAGEQEVDPATVAPVSMKQNGVFGTYPGARVFFNDTGGGQKPTIGRLFESKFNPEIAMQLKEWLIARVRRWFFEDVFTMFSSQQMAGGGAATELKIPQIEQMRDEKLLRMGGVFGPWSKPLEVAINRYFRVLLRAGKIPPPPDDLVGQDWNVEFKSILAQAQKAVGVANIERGVAFAGNYAALSKDPGIFDTFKSDKMMRRYWDDLSADPTLLNSPEEVAAIQQQRQQMMAAQAAAAAAKDGTQAMKTLAETPTEGDNYLNAMAGAVG
jgi:hypothetical protein